MRDPGTFTFFKLVIRFLLEKVSEDYEQLWAEIHECTYFIM